MPRATLFQRLLNNPSQSYSFPQTKDYHSTKPTLLKIATGGDLYINDFLSVGYSGSINKSPRLDNSLSTATLSPKTENASSHQLNHEGYCDLVQENVATDSDSDHEAFYTPCTSSSSSSPKSFVPVLANAPQLMPSIKLTPSSPQNLSEEWLLTPSRTPSPSSIDSMSVSTSPNDSWSEMTETAETDSIFSSSMTTSTRVTTPANSDYGLSKGSNSSGVLTAITISSTSSRVPSQKSKRVPSRESMYTDEDWARDVRWLVPPQSSTVARSTKTKPKRRQSVMLNRAAILPHPDPPNYVKSRRGGKGKGRMSALLEVSEDEDPAQTTYSRNSSSNVSYARRSIRLQVEQSALRSSSRSRPGSIAQVRSSKSPSPSRRHRSAMPSPLPVLTSSEAPAPPSRGIRPYSSLTLARASTLPPLHAGYSSSARKSGFLTGANILDKLKIEDSGQVDLTRSGMATTTMATIEVIKGAAETLRGRGISRSLSWKVKPQSKRARRTSSGMRDRSHSPTSSRRLSATSSPLGFCSHHSPPSNVPPNHVLVQVWAVGLDGRDGIIVSKEKTGFVPGRSFAGRVIETGWEVRDDVVRKGEWVVGLIDIKKCGALAEFIVVERHRIHRVSQPASVIIPSDERSATFTPSGLTIEELALIPLCGVSAYRAVKTFGPIVFNNIAPSLHTRRRVLVLEGHQGSGSFSVQMLVRMGWNVVVQVSPRSSAGNSLDVVDRRLKSWGVEEVCPGEAMSVLRRLLERCETENYVVDGVLDTIGGHDIWSASQQVLQRTLKGSTSDLQKAEFVNPPQFTTLVGDDREQPIPTTQGHFKAGLRSLKRAMTGNGAACAYTWISVGADIDGDGLDVRHALAGIIKVVEDTGGAVKPWVVAKHDVDSEPMSGRVVVFEKTPQVFVNGGESLSNGGTVVVKLVE